MADLTRAELGLLMALFRSSVGRRPIWGLSLRAALFELALHESDPDEVFDRLLDMASRAASEELVSAVAVFIDAGKAGRPREALTDAANAILKTVLRDFGPAAEELARRNG